MILSYSLITTFALYYIAHGEKYKISMTNKIMIKTDVFYYFTCMSRFKKTLLDHKSMRYAVIPPVQMSYVNMIVPITMHLSTARNSYLKSETRRPPDVIIVIHELHVRETKYLDSIGLRPKNNRSDDNARSEVIARMPAQRMTPLAEGVAAGASRRLAGRPMVGRPLETKGIKGGVATARELILRQLLNVLRLLVRVVRYPDSIIRYTNKRVYTSACASILL